MSFINGVHSRNAQLPGDESRITRERHQVLNETCFLGNCVRTRNQTRVVVKAKDEHRRDDLESQKPERESAGCKKGVIFGETETSLVTRQWQVLLFLLQLIY